MSDNVNSPSHYQGKGMEVIDVIDAFDLDLYQGSIVQYIIRYKHKNGIEDVRKAHWYLTRLLDRLEKEKENDSTSSVSPIMDNQSRYSTRRTGVGSGVQPLSGLSMGPERVSSEPRSRPCASYHKDEHDHDTRPSESE